ncbi:AI-2E family transporter [Patescibacteria group bacterium]|nr:AI-2E family transporter [Patescibacteria group bacterium]
MAKTRQLLDISILSILKFFLVVICLYFLFLIKEVIAILFVSLIFASSVDPWVDKLEKIKIPRGLGILLIYFVVFVFLVSVVYFLIPPFVTQIGQLSVNFPEYYEKTADMLSSLKTYSAEHGLMLDLSNGVDALRNNLAKSLQSILGTIFAIFGGMVSLVIILVVTFYLTVEESSIKRTITFILPEKYNEFAMQLINKIQVKIGSWLKGQLILCLIVGLMAYIGLLILGVNYALILGVVAALGEFIPYVGPIAAAVPAIFLAFTQSPVKALLVLLLFIIIQQLENNLLVPKVMQKAVGLNPIVSITALLIGARIGGIVGIILAIPVATAISVIVKEFWKTKETVEKIETTPEV